MKASLPLAALCVGFSCAGATTQTPPPVRKPPIERRSLCVGLDEPGPLHQVGQHSHNPQSDITSPDTVQGVFFLQLSQAVPPGSPAETPPTLLSPEEDTGPGDVKSTSASESNSPQKGGEGSGEPDAEDRLSGIFSPASLTPSQSQFLWNQLNKDDEKLQTIWNNSQTATIPSGSPNLVLHIIEKLADFFAKNTPTLP